MSNPAELAARTYAAAFAERDRAARAKLLEACFAVDGRIIARAREIRGRAALADEIETFLTDPRGLTVRLTSAIDGQGQTFRLSAVAEHAGGSLGEFHDAGLIDADGRIVLILTFAGPLPPPR